MRLTQLAYGYQDSEMPDEVASFALPAEEARMSSAEMKAKAAGLVFGAEYLDYKNRIRDYVTACAQELIETSGAEKVQIRTRMDRLMTAQGILLALLVVAMIGEVAFITLQIRIPLARMVEKMRRQAEAEPMGAAELRFVTQTYNDILEVNRQAHRQLSYEASHDQLTGLMNRYAYELFMSRADTDHIALMIVDVDELKHINDTYGHDVGDRALKRVAEVLQQSFRSVDAVCRLGGDEFVVVMTRANSSMRQLVANKIARANSLLQNPKDGLPKVSVSVGVAFSDRADPQGDIFKDADTALYEMKKKGRCGCVIYGPDPQAVREG